MVIGNLTILHIDEVTLIVNICHRLYILLLFDREARLFFCNILVYVVFVWELEVVSARSDLRT